MISFRRGGEPQDLISLWCEVFGDTPKYVEHFLDHAGANSLCAYEGDTLAAMLHLLPVTVTGENPRKGYYLYAAATTPQFRCQGVMTKLLDFAKEYTVETGRDSIFLLPASEPLRSYYTARGYQTISFVEEVTFPPCTSFDGAVTPCNKEAFVQQRQEYLCTFPSALTPEAGYASFVWEHTMLQGGEVLQISKSTLQAYAVCYTINGELWVEETSASKEDYPLLAAGLSAAHGGLPVRMRRSGETPFGMAISCNDTPISPCYMNGLLE